MTATSPSVRGLSFDYFKQTATGEDTPRLVPLWRRIFSDHLTPVELYRCMVSESDNTTPSFLLESVTNDGNAGRYSFVGARPVMEVLAKEFDVAITDYRAQRAGKATESSAKRVEGCQDPWQLMRDITEQLPAAQPEGLPRTFTGGWVGYGGYDTVRYGEIESLPFEEAPKDDRGLPDLHMGLYQSSVTFDHFEKVCYAIVWVDLEDFDRDLQRAHANGMQQLDELTRVIQDGVLLSPLSSGTVDIDPSSTTKFHRSAKANMTRGEFDKAIEQCLYHMSVGDTFQVVFSQRFEREAKVDPFSVYRALRIVNPSPYMIYVQCAGCTLVASSPEILCKVKDRVVTNRPLAGTRWRGATEEEDLELEKNLLADDKENAEHLMLVDLGRNDLGRVSEYGSVDACKLFDIERYSHVMHISSTVKGKLREGLTSWDALRATLPAGTISGAPKIRAMQVIDSLEPTRRGPYGGGIGYISFHDDMNIALALRTMVVPTTPEKRDKWTYYLQAGAGIVADSVASAEYTECVNKAMAMARAIDLAESAFE